MTDLQSRFLITTADERSWKFDRPVLFLGEWCRLFERRASWANLDASIVPYHWDDRAQLHADYCHLRGVHETLLAEVAAALNEWHGVDHSLRYWRILVGPWLGYFAQIVFDRWVMIQRAAASELIEGTTVLVMPEGQMIPNDMPSFNELYCGDSWNHHIFASILTRWTDIPWQSSYAGAVLTPGSQSRAAPRNPSVKRRLRQLASRAFSSIAQPLRRDSDAMLTSTYLPLLQEFRLGVALGQAPMMRRSPMPTRSVAKTADRTRLVLAKSESGGYDGCVRSLISEQIPAAYLEGYEALVAQAKALPWPSRPKVIFTSNQHVDDEVFKVWAADVVERGARLVIGQHGGHFGSGLWSFLEEHERGIGDRYVTWGWKNGNRKETPVAALPLVGKGDGDWNPKGGLLLVTAAFPRYSYWMYSTPVAGQTVEYLNEQLDFARALPDSIRERLLVRLYRADFGWAQKARWSAALPQVRLNLGTGPIAPLIRESRLYVATYNATTFLETLGRNIPTIIYWNPAHWELRPSAKPYFAGLREAGIFHETPADAAAKVATIWNEVEEWWTSAEIQKARRDFCDRFVRRSPHPIRELTKALTEF